MNEMIALCALYVVLNQGLSQAYCMRLSLFRRVLCGRGVRSAVPRESREFFVHLVVDVVFDLVYGRYTPTAVYARTKTTRPARRARVERNTRTHYQITQPA